MNEGLVDTQLLSAGPFSHALRLLMVRAGRNGPCEPAQLRHLLRGRGVERMILSLGDNTGVFPPHCGAFVVSFPC